MEENKPSWGERSETLDREKLECRLCREVEWGQIPVFATLHAKERQGNPSVMTLYDWDRRVKHFVCPDHGLLGREPANPSSGAMTSERMPPEVTCELHSPAIVTHARNINVVDHRWGKSELVLTLNCGHRVYVKADTL